NDLWLPALQAGEPTFEPARLDSVEISVLASIQKEMFVCVCPARKDEYLRKPVNKYLVAGFELSGDLRNLGFLIFQCWERHSDPDDVSNAEDQYQQERECESVQFEFFATGFRTCAASQFCEQAYHRDDCHCGKDRYEREQRYQIDSALNVDRAKCEVHNGS